MERIRINEMGEWMRQGMLRQERDKVRQSKRVHV